MQPEINQEAIARMLDQVQKPTRYTGGEMNTQLKPWDSAKLHFAFCFPDTYEVGMSHLGMKILYAAMNQQPDMLCERAFMPWVDMMDLMSRKMSRCSRSKAAARSAPLTSWALRCNMK